MRIDFISVTIEDSLLHQDDNYNQKNMNRIKYFLHLQKSDGISRKQLNFFKNEVMRYKVQNGHFFRRNSKNVFLRRVVDSFENRFRIIQHFHDEIDHKERESIYRKIVDRYWWNNLHQEVRQYIQICEECHKRSGTRTEEALHPTWVSLLWEKVVSQGILTPEEKTQTFAGLVLGLV